MALRIEEDRFSGEWDGVNFFDFLPGVNYHFCLRSEITGLIFCISDSTGPIKAVKRSYVADHGYSRNFIANLQEGNLKEGIPYYITDGSGKTEQRIHGGDDDVLYDCRPDNLHPPKQE